MFFLNKPDDTFVRAFLEQHQDAPFSYPEVGASRVTAPQGYTVDHNRVLLGKGRETYARAVAAVNAWKMFNMAWLELCWSSAPVAEGVVVGVLVRHFGFWSLSACRVVYVLAETDEGETYGFAYGTLPAHAERGEERFTVEYHWATDEVWYDLYAFSVPANALVKVGRPLGRWVQKRFVNASQAAMMRAAR